MGTTKKASNAIAKMDDVASVIGVLDAKIKSLDHISDSKYKTSGNLDGFGDIKKETNISNLIKAYSSIKGRETAYNAAAEEMNVGTYPVFEVNGSSAEDWKNDIMLRIAIINHKETLDKLTEYKEKMTQFMSKEEQKAVLLKEMAAFLGK
jgi:hypothetical protein